MATGFRFPNRNDNIVLLYQRVIHHNEFALGAGAIPPVPGAVLRSLAVAIAVCPRRSQ
jgi:hypothetical protein